jgi:fibronectin-binding autotransporter adhesin
MSGRTISNSYSSEITLTNTADNPVTVTGTIDAATQTALYGTTPGVWTIINQGLIDSGDASGITLGAGGTVSNISGGVISGHYGIDFGLGAGTLLNAGSVTGVGTDGFGVRLDEGGLVSNSATGVITGTLYGIYGFDLPGTVLNSASIGASGTVGTGVYLSRGGTVSNAAGGIISGELFGVRLGNGTSSAHERAATVTNAGTIAASGSGADAISLASGFANLVVVDPGAVFVGNVDGGNTPGRVKASRLEFASAASTQTLTGLGTQFVNFATISIDAGDAWVLTGSNSIAAGSRLLSAPPLINDGTLTNAGRILEPLNLGSGASVTNLAGGTIVGSTGTAIYAVSGGAGNLVKNAGRITAASGAAVQLNSGGTVSSALHGVILGYAGGVVISNIGTVLNQGTIAADRTAGVGVGVALTNGGLVSNATTGTISSDSFGIYFSGAGTVLNDGVIAGPGLDGIVLHAGGTLTNSVHGTITGNYSAVAFNAAGTVHNAGTIATTSGSAINLEGGGDVSIASTGTVSGEGYGITMGGEDATVDNAGGVAGTDNPGVALFGGGSVTNEASAVITGYRGVQISGGAGTVINRGSIGTPDNVAVALGIGYTNRLIVDPGASFNGEVDGGNMIGNSIVSTFELGAGSGTLSAFGTKFVNFGSIVFDTGAHWFIGGDTSGLGGTISGFAADDTIELTGITVTGSDYAGGILTLDDVGGTISLTLPGSFTTADFQVTNVAAGADVALSVPCFRAGTLIGTPRGERPVEALAVGEDVTVLDGARRTVVWIGHRRIDCRRHPDPRRVLPIRITAGAFGPGCPHRDLLLSPDHALFVDEVLIPVRHLVNGSTVCRQQVAEVEYYHIELECHDILLAEGLPTESYLDTGDRRDFANGGGVMTLHPDLAARARDALGYAPLCVTGPILHAVRERLRNRATAMAA